MRQRTLLEEFFQYVVLNVCGMIGLSCYILADTYFVSKGLGAYGLAALNLAIPIYSFVHGCGLMMGMGGATRYSIFRGQQKYETANKVFSNTVYFTVTLAVLFVLMGLFFSGEFAALLGADKEIFDMTKTYLRVILLFSPAFMMNDVLICFVRNDGNPRLSMMAMLIGSFANIVLDYIFIFPLRMGILGAVLATGCAPVISMAIMSRHWIKKQNRFHLEKNKISASLAGKIISLGTPSLIIEVASGIVMIVFNSLILQLRGNIGVAAYGVVANLSLVVSSIYTGIAQGTQPIASRAYGQRDKGGVRKSLKYAVLTMLLLSGVIYLVLLFAANPIIEVFNSEQNKQLQQIAIKGLKLYFTAIPFVGFNIIISGYFTSTGKAVPAQVVSLLRGLFLIIPAALLLSALFGVTGVWLSYPITEGIVAITGIVLYKRFSHHDDKTKKERKFCKK